MMGCGTSTENVLEEANQTIGLTNQTNHINPDTVVNEFVQLDIRIGKLEGTCPGPRLATIEAWIEHLQAERNILRGVDADVDVMTNVQRRENLTQNEQESITAVLPSTSSTNGIAQNGYLGYQQNNIVKDAPSKDLANLALKMGVIGDIQKASTHEDFFSNLSESALYLISTRHYTDILQHTQVRLKTLQESYAELNDLYINHDGIIAFISGGTYMTRTEEQLDAQLEVARDIREKLGSALEQWRLCGTLLRTSAISATQALQQWRKIENLVNPHDKIHLALECRYILQGSLVSLDCAHLALPHVEIKHISNRQILAVKHCNVYMITDIANLDRYRHTAKVFTAYEGNINKASHWLYETFNKTLKKDFEKAEETVQSLAKSLRDHREQIFTSVRERP